MMSDIPIGRRGTGILQLPYTKRIWIMEVSRGVPWFPSCIQNAHLHGEERTSCAPIKVYFGVRRSNEREVV